MGKLIARLLICTALATITAQAQAEAIEAYQQFIVVGQTSKPEIRQKLGLPQEMITEPGVDIWVYSNKLEIPLLVSLIPIVGDIADAIELLQNVQKNHELIIQFDASSTVKKVKLRELD